MVADIHRNLIKGGVFIYPATQTHPDGKLRLNYECNPMSFIIEQAGGMATSGDTPILAIRPKALHQRSPIIIGSVEMVKEVKQYLKYAGVSKDS